MADNALLQAAWFLLVGVLLVAYAILDGFDLGVGMQHLTTARTDDERRVLMNSIGPVWDGNEVWLITAGGALFAAFPKVYATVFSGFYLAMMLVLAGLILRAVSLEFRSKERGRAWRATWDVAFFVGSVAPAVLFGVAIGNVMRGSRSTARATTRGPSAGSSRRSRLPSGCCPRPCSSFRAARGCCSRRRAPCRHGLGGPRWPAESRRSSSGCS